jgi:chromosome segregation ATPase
MCITRGILRWGLIGGMALAGLALAFPSHSRAAFAQIKSRVHGVADKFIDDPVALRSQLENLARTYPDRIAEVRGELAAVEHQVAQFQRDTEIARRVVAMTTEDLSKLKMLCEKAEAKATETGSVVAIRFENRRFDNSIEAKAEAARINSVRVSYQDRLASNDAQLEMLSQQKTALVEILTKLETEFQRFETQLFALNREIDAIQRNERLIEMTEELQDTLNSYSKWGEVGNLSQIEGKLAELRTQQQAQLDVLRNKGLRRDYAAEAECQLHGGTSADPYADVFEGIDSAEDINAEDDDANEGTVAWAGGPIIVE